MGIKFKIFILFVIIVTGGCLVFLNYINSIPKTELVSNIFEIQKGMGVNEISEALKQAGLIKSKFIFETYVYLKGLEKNFLAGDYKFGENKSIKQIVEMLTSGKEALLDKEIKIIEGWNNREIGEYLESKGIVSRDEFLDEVMRISMRINANDDANIDANSGEWQYEFLESKPEGIDIEGYLFPDTYRVNREPTVEEVVKKMLDNFDKKLTDELREEIAKQGKIIHEIITLASIVEKEVHEDEDRKIVAGIFYNRLEMGKALQSDATVNYVTGKKEVQPSYDDTEIDSPYNTYKYKGLPSGPICNPGLSAIEAAIYPTETDYLYFLTTPEGETVFSKTYEEHLIAKEKYLAN